MAKNNNTASQTFIEINGKRYDPRTGEQIHAVSRLISDVVPVQQIQTVALEQFASPSAPLKTIGRTINDVRPVGHLRPHQPQRAQTLMRSAVRPPKPGIKKRLKAVSSTDILIKRPAAISVNTKLSYHQTDPKRLAHAARVSQSELVRKFANDSHGNTSTATTTASDTLRSAAVSVHAPHAAHSPKSMDIFEKALAKADAHTEKPVHPKKLAKAAHKAAKKTRRANAKPLHHRTGSILAASLAVLLLTGFLAYTNKTALELHYASAQAGFQASRPHYQPAGFTIGKLSYRPGLVSLAYTNHASNQSFTLNQQASTWNSQDLLDKIVASMHTSYQTLQHGGQTVYIYSNNDAAWVSDGILYQLNSNGNLSTSQVLNVATST